MEEMPLCLPLSPDSHFLLLVALIRRQGSISSSLLAPIPLLALRASLFKTDESRPSGCLFLFAPAEVLISWTPHGLGAKANRWIHQQVPRFFPPPILFPRRLGCHIQASEITTPLISKQVKEITVPFIPPFCTGLMTQLSSAESSRSRWNLLGTPLSLPLSVLPLTPSMRPSGQRLPRHFLSHTDTHSSFLRLIPPSPVNGNLIPFTPCFFWVPPTSLNSNG